MADDLPKPGDQITKSDGVEPTDILKYAETEMASRVAWAIKSIAEHCYQVRPVPKAWAGRDQLAKAATEIFGLPEIEAYNLVDLTVGELFDRSGGDAKHVDRRLMLMRLAGIRNLVMQAIKNGRRESTYQYDPHKTDPNKLVERKVKEKRYDGTDMSAIGRLIEIEQFEAQLKNLFEDEDKGLGSALELFESLQDAVDSRKIPAGSAAQRLREMTVDQLPVEGHMQIIAAVRQVGKKKVVKSRPVDPLPEE